MFHSVASQLEYLRTLNKTLQSLVNEELSKTFRPLLDGDERTVRETNLYYSLMKSLLEIIEILM